MKTMKKIAIAAVSLLVGVSTTAPAFAAEVLLYGNEVEEVNANDLVLDFDDTGGDITLQFGETLGETFLWNNALGRFELSDDLYISGGNITLDALATVDGIDLDVTIGNTTYTQDNVVTDGQSLTASIDALDQAVGGVGDRLITNEGNFYVLNGFDNTTLTAMMNQINDELGNRLYTNDNVVTDGQTVTASIDALDTEIGDTTYTNDFVVADADTLAQSVDKLDTAFGDRNYVDGNVVVDGQSVTASIDALSVATGDRTYTADNVLTDGESITASLDALDQAVGGTGDRLITNEGNFYILNGFDSATLTAMLNQMNDEVGNRVYTNDNVLTDGQTLTASLDALDTAFGNRTFTNDNVVTDGQTVTASIDALDTEIGDTTYTNDFVVADADTLAQSVDKIDTAFGNRTYTADNVVTDGESLTASIDALDQAIGAVGATNRSFEVTMNDLTVEADGTNNTANLYNDYDDNGTGAVFTDDHEFYFVKTRQAALQDLDMKFKVLVPADFAGFQANGLSFFYRNEGGVDLTDSRIDITVADAAGNTSTTTPAFSAAWAEHTVDLATAGLVPNPGEYLYVTVKGSASRDGAVDQMPYMGEIVFNYTNS